MATSAIEAAAGTGGVGIGAIVGPDFEQNPPSFGPAALGEVDVRGIAFDGHNYLVAWQFWGNRQWAQVARVSPDGHLLDLVAKDINDPSIRETVVGVASDGTGFVVAYRVDDPLDSRRAQYRIKRISSDGVILDATGIPLTDMTHSSGELRIVSSGGNYLAVWTDQAAFSYSDPYTIRAALIDDATATPTIRYFDVGQTLSSTVGCYVKLAAAASRDGYMVAYTTRTGDDYQSGFDIALSTISRDGVLGLSPVSASTRLILGASSNNELYLSTDGDAYYLAWTDFAKNAQGQWREAVYGVGISHDGTFDAAIPTQLTTADSDHRAPEVVFDGSRYLISYVVPDPLATSYAGQLRGRYVSQARLATIEPESVLFEGHVDALAFATSCNGPCFLALSSDVMHTRDTIFSGMYDSAQGPLKPSALTTVSLQPEEEGFRDLVCAKDGCVALYTVTQHDLTGEHIYLKAAGLDANGRLRANAVSTLTEVQDHFTFETALASDGAAYLVTWWDATERSLYTQRLDSQGIPVPSHKRVIVQGTSLPYHLELAYSGQSYVLVRAMEQDNRTVLNGSLLDPSGSVLAASAFTIDPGYNVSIYATHLIPAAGQFYLGFVKDGRATIARLNSEGALIANSIFSVKAGDGTFANVYAMASNGEQLLIGWCNPNSKAAGSSACVPRATIVAADGTQRILNEPLGPACVTGALLWDANALVWAWAESVSWSGEPYQQHLTELRWSEQGQLESRDTVVERPVGMGGVGTFTMNGAGLLWTYPSPTGKPQDGLVGPLRIHRRQITSLCWAGPNGDSDADGVCDSANAAGGAGGGSSGNIPPGLGGNGGTSATTGSAGAGVVISGQGGSVPSTTTAGTSGGSVGATEDGATTSGGTSHSMLTVTSEAGGTNGVTRFGNGTESGRGNLPENTTQTGGARSSWNSLLHSSSGAANASNSSPSTSSISGGASAVDPRKPSTSGSAGASSSGSEHETLPGAAGARRAFVRDDGSLQGSGCSCRVGTRGSFGWAAAAMYALALGALRRRTAPKRTKR